MLLTEIGVIDEVLRAHAAVLGRDFDAYRNHAYRVANFCRMLCAPDPDGMRKIAVAAVFHDIGIWTERTFDYLTPSISAARAYLAGSGEEAWAAEVAAMIDEHHKISAVRSHPSWLVEPFRKADWVDVSRGLRSFGLPRAAREPVFAAWPNAGLHRRLVQLSLERLRTHPASPLPMLRL